VTCDVQRCNGQVMADTELTQGAGRHHHAIMCCHMQCHPRHLCGVLLTSWAVCWEQPRSNC
jgi:hypothetical protein